MSRDEKIMLGTMAFAVVLWVTGDAIGVSSVVAAMLGKPSAMSQRLVTRVNTVIKMPMVSSLCMAVQHGRGLRQINARGGEKEPESKHASTCKVKRDK